MSDWPFSGLRRGAYGAIACDPPWSFETWGKQKTTPHRSTEEPYSVMSLDDIKALPVGELAKRDCALFLWVVDTHLDQAMEVGRSWGFAYRSIAFNWLKTTKDGSKFRMGLGMWSRKESEICLLFTRGKPRRMSKSVRQIIQAPRREHSRKPDEQYERIKALVVGPYCELFAKHRVPGVEGWGNEYPKIDQRRHITSLIDGLREQIGEGSP